MRNMIICLGLLLAISSCNKDDELSPEERKTKNDENIISFLNKNTFIDGYLTPIEDNNGDPVFGNFTKTSDGIYYWITDQGTGASPTALDSVLVHYRGSLVSNNEVFDTTLEKTGTPLWLDLNSTIQGWKKILPLLKSRVGKDLYSNYANQIIIVIPSQMAYEGSPIGGEVDANLVFQIELYDIEKDTDNGAN